MPFANSLQREIWMRLLISLLVVIGLLHGASACAQQNAEMQLPKADFFLATNPNIAKTLAFINGALVGKLRFIGQHNPAGKVLMGMSQLLLRNDSDRHHRTFVRFETRVMEDMSNGSNPPRSHLSVATAFRDDLNIEAASSNGDYVLVPCKTGKKCVDNRLLLSSSYYEAPASLPGLGALVRSVWAPPSVLAVGPFPEGQAESMVPVVRYLLSR